MPNWLAIPLVMLFALPADLPKISSLKPAEHKPAEAFPPGETIRVLPQLAAGDDQGAAPAKPAQGKKSETLQESSKLALIRYVSGEYAKARKALPGGKEGVILQTDKPPNYDSIERVVASHGAAINTGDNVQITKLEFHERSITVDLNGGNRAKRNWRDHLQIGIGGVGPVTQTSTTQAGQDQGPPGMQPGMGSTIYVQFPKSVPDLSPDDLKKILDPFLDFSKARSASVQWFDTLPPEMKKAITERRAVVGMDREEVVAAIGKPDRKVRERDPQGNDIEDWIYGKPPSKTVFVQFTGERVTSIKQYPQ